jgi:hypothetical protein
LIKTWNGLNVLASPSIRRLIATRRELPTLHSIGLTGFLYQRDGEIIASARSDLAVSGTGSSSVAPVAAVLLAAALNVDASGAEANGNSRQNLGSVG